MIDPKETLRRVGLDVLACAGIELFVATYLTILAAQRADAAKLVAAAEHRGWINEAECHRRLLARLDTAIADANYSRIPETPSDPTKPSSSMGRMMW
ncbi:hypothetical protein [Nocardia yunnanensis]|uniref:hypothetical protein n=1 Tax=Nocardia yunnanensis TaxID=2382165 RepID=UPI0013C5099B|nr:hypothetical protein [Nocardia yunnanensis]